MPFVVTRQGSRPTSRRLLGPRTGHDGGQSVSGVDAAQSGTYVRARVPFRVPTAQGSRLKPIASQGRLRSLHEPEGQPSSRWVCQGTITADNTGISVFGDLGKRPVALCFTPSVLWVRCSDRIELRAL